MPPFRFASPSVRLRVLKERHSLRSCIIESYPRRVAVLARFLPPSVSSTLRWRKSGTNLRKSLRTRKQEWMKDTLYLLFHVMALSGN